MPYFILIVFLLVIIGLAIDWTRTRRLIGSKWFWWIDLGPHEEMDDNEMRYDSHVKDVDVDLLACADDHIKEPDEYLERLIEEEKFILAMNYRVEMANLARVRKDPEMLTKYAIYGARISAKRVEVDDRKHEIVSRNVEEKREREKKARRESMPEEPVSAEGWRMPAIGKPPRPPLWSEKPPEPEKPAPVIEPALINLNAEPSSLVAPPKKPKRRYLEFGPLGRFKPPRRPSI